MPQAATVWAGIGGAAEGLAKGYSWQKEHEQKDRAISSREEIARLREEIRQMIADATNRTRVEVAGIGASSRENVAGIGATSRENVATINQTGANYRHDAVSGDTTAREAGADRRLTRNIDFGYDLEAGRNRRHTTPSGNAVLGSETTRRGQDIGAATSRRGQDLTFQLGTRGQDVTASTAARGQDVRSRDSRYSADKRNAMFQGIFGPTPITPTSSPQPQEPPPPADAAAPAPTPAPTGRTPVTPPTTEPRVQPQANDAPADREQRRRTRFEQIKREIADRQRKGQDITDLIRELQQLRTQGGGGL
jgi:hypothetical protein